MRLMALAAALAATAALAAAPAALAADQTVQAVDGPNMDDPNLWSPTDVTIKAGETVTWSFTGAVRPHNVYSESAGFKTTDFGPGQAPFSFTFTTPGVYPFVCQVHADTMTGTVTVTDAAGTPPPPPPPPPLSEQPFPNDAGAPPVLEVRDTLRPRISRVRARGRAHGARVRFRIDEPALVKLRVKRARVTVKRRKLVVRKGGTRKLYVGGLDAGRYRIEIVARDLAGNRSKKRRKRVTVG